MYLRQFCIDDIYVFNHVLFSFVFVGLAYVFDLVGGCINKRKFEFTDLSRDQEVSSIANGVVIRRKQIYSSGCAARQALRRKQIYSSGCAARQAFCRFSLKTNERSFRYYHFHRPKAFTGMDFG